MSTKEAKTAAPPKGVTPPSASGGRSGFLSDVIVQLGFAERAAVEQAVRAARSPGTTVARVLVESGAITEEQLAHATAERYGIAYIDLGRFAVEPSAANLIKPSAAKRYQAVPVGFVGGGLLVAMADPADALGVNDIAVMTKMDVKPAVASRPALDALLEALPLTEDFDAADAGSAARAGDRAPEYAAEEPTESGTSAVFWQADPNGGNGVQETLPEDSGPDPVHDSSAAGEEVEGLRAELADLRQRLAAAERPHRDGVPGEDELRDLRERLSASSAELDQATARARDAERAAEEAAALQEELASVKKELKRARADVDVRTEEMDSLRERLTGAETELVRARAGAEEAAGLRERLEAVEAELAEAAADRAEAKRRVAELEAERADAERRIEELEDADRRAEDARQALAEMREETERQREQQLIEERELRGQLEEAEARRGELEERLAEVESSAFAAERAFEELRGAQQRMRAALRALAGPDAEDDADAGEDD
jgi:Type II secretion system (T2SS), protein E, N-terminal domain